MSSAAIDKKSIDLTPYVRRGSGLSHLDLIVTGARCGGCLAKIEQGLNSIPGVRHARMNLTTSHLRISWDGQANEAESFAKTLRSLGFESGPVDPTERVSKAGNSETRYLLLCMGVAAFGLMNVMMLSVGVWSGSADMSEAERNLLHMISAAIALPVALYSGRPFFRSAWRALKAKTTNMDVPISLAILLACGLSVFETVQRQEHAYFDAALMLIFLLLVGRFLDARLRARTGQAAAELAALQQVTSRRVNPDGTITTVPASDIVPGDELLIPTGAHIPTDAIVLSGCSQIDAAIVTGEPVPQRVEPDDKLYSGCLNIDQPLRIKAIKAADDSFLAEIANLVEAGQQTQTRYVNIADRAARAYVPIVHSLALLTCLGWFAVGGSPRTAIINAIAVLIITCPCALGLAVPAVQFVSVGRLFREGIIVKSGAALERLSEVKGIVFDKTGTLTQIHRTANLSAVSTKDLSIFAALAQHSTHPATAHLRDIATNMMPMNMSEVSGQGVVGEYKGQTIRMGQRRFVTGLKGPDLSGLWGRIGSGPLIDLSGGETLRPEAPAAIEKLKQMNLDIHLLSGDSGLRVSAIAKETGIVKALARVSPKAKSDYVLAQQAEGVPVLMVGDGLNDAPALANAHASAALTTGADISRSASDIVLRRESLSGLPYAIRMARASRLAIIQNFGFAIIYNILAVPLAIFGFVTPLVAALAMSLSSLIVTLNALRLNRITPEVKS